MKTHVFTATVESMEPGQEEWVLKLEGNLRLERKLNDVIQKTEEEYGMKAVNLIVLEVDHDRSYPGYKDGYTGGSISVRGILLF